MTAEDIIRLLELKPHPEGGYYRETYRSGEGIAASALPERFGNYHNYSTSILFLLKDEEFSCLHKIKSDETWHFYMGDPLVIVSFNIDGILEQAHLGNRLDQGEIPQLVIPHGYWFGAGMKKKQGFALVGCTVAPGFDFEDITFGKRAELLNQYPHLEDIILEYTR